MAESSGSALAGTPKQTTEETQNAMAAGGDPRIQATATSPLSKGGEKFEKLQRVFSENFRALTEPVKHDKTSVLLLSWEKDGSDMDVSDEVFLHGILVHQATAHEKLIFQMLILF